MAYYDLIEITVGGNRYELEAQLSDIGRITEGKRPFFPLSVCLIRGLSHTGYYDLKGVYVDGLRASDFSGNAWTIYGFVSKEIQELMKWEKPRFVGKYNTKTWAGELTEEV